MTMSDVADELNLSVSTISRGIKNKYIQYPNGIVPLKSLFSTGLSQTGNEEISCSQVTLLLHQLIQHENKAKPFSDQALTNALIQKGIHISRRTVTKYRTLANIPNASGKKSNTDLTVLLFFIPAVRQIRRVQHSMLSLHPFYQPVL